MTPAVMVLRTKPGWIAKTRRSYWIPGSYALALSEKGDSFLRLLKHKGFREENMTKVGLYAIGTSTTLESNKSLPGRPAATKRHLFVRIQPVPTVLNPAASTDCQAVRRYRWDCQAR